MFEIYKKHIAKMESRISKIEASPDPTKLLSNKLRYELERDKMLEEIHAFEGGQLIGHSVCGIGARLFVAMGAHYIHPSITADSVFSPYARQLLDIGVKLGFPERGCERTILPIAAIADKQMPPPSFTVATTDSCDWMAHECEAIARMVGCPSYTIDTSPIHDEKGLNYITDQMYEMVDYLHKKVPGLRSFADSEEDLAVLQERYGKMFGHIREVYKFMMHVPSPLPNGETFRIPWLDRLPKNGLDKSETYFRMFRDEVGERVVKKIEGVPGERLRIMLAVSGPFYSDLLKYLEKRQIAMVVVYNGLVPSYVGVAPSMFDKNVFGRKLSPMEVEARRQQDISWGSMGEIWAEHGVRLCQAFQCDAILYLLQSGCTPTLGTWKLLAEKAEKELGIPTLAYDGRMMISDEYDEKKLHDLVDIFFEMKS